MVRYDCDGISGQTMGDGCRAALLEASGMFDTLLYLRTVDECRKTDLYKAIGRGSEMAPKLNRLEDAGLIHQTRYERVTILCLTEEGHQVADQIAIIQKIIGELEAHAS